MCEDRRAWASSPQNDRRLQSPTQRIVRSRCSSFYMSARLRKSIWCSSQWSVRQGRKNGIASVGGASNDHVVLHACSKQVPLRDPCFKCLQPLASRSKDRGCSCKNSATEVSLSEMRVSVMWKSRQRTSWTLRSIFKL